MSKCIFKEIADKLNKEEVEEYYKTHLPKDVAKYFNFDQKYFIRIFDYLNIKRRTSSENTKIQFLYYDQTERNKKVSNGLKGHITKEETRIKISNSNKGIKRNATSTSFSKGHKPWNAGKKGVQHWKDGQKEKYYSTLAQNGWYKRKTKIEIQVEKELVQQYGRENVIYQYHSDARYPFNCDFYIISEDLFIEVNNWWHHGPHPLNPNNEEDINLLNEWKEKAKTSSQFQAAIYTWTVRDQLKIKTAKENNLNYKLIYRI